MGRLFGTDGVRGLANTELTCELSLKIGRAAAYVLTQHTHHRPKILIGRDTRLSGEMLEAALTAGLCSVGADVHLLGVVPTPAVAYLVGLYQADAGIMISASHNPAEYNGIKIFNTSGYKIPDQYEEEIEAIVLDDSVEVKLAMGDAVGVSHPCESAVEDYVKHIVSTTDTTFEGIHVLIDCANGSASATAHKIFPALKASAEIIANKPDGVNINRNCGSMHIHALAERVKNGSYDLGLAFDGDSDRILACDADGNIVDGDMLMAAFAMFMKQQGTLDGNTLVVTVMSNLGLIRCAEESGINIACTKVGDRFVLEKMLEEGYALGGEQSGHLILKHFATTGDGQLSAVQLLTMMKKTGKSLKELASIMTVYPQVMVNVEAGKTAKVKLAVDKDINALIKSWEDRLAQNGRILVRASGTEPLIRVMVEGKDLDLINRCANEIADMVKTL
ncbi:phosphoglucosamine mutase [Acetanaerobacterium elongatum]|uniref:Phosphoglucosamine mutase n=1 Tax=Acetanaerobacterium elongatum TaxID=258515 RepID=A0A1G9V8P3_9FIRM|nr:phosphoglucosamine mutase [Acetanaerobacterium elongatum]SDM68578.1 phosphoglucosamine mutase [Acetanaerobacterium elongatum]